jgi:hypothetical protein
MDLLMQELSTRCQRIFHAAASATAQSAVIENLFERPAGSAQESGVHNSSDSPLFVRERTVDTTSQVRQLD